MRSLRLASRSLRCSSGPALRGRAPAAVQAAAVRHRNIRRRELLRRRRRRGSVRPNSGPFIHFSSQRPISKKPKNKATRRQAAMFRSASLTSKSTSKGPSPTERRPAAFTHIRTDVAPGSPRTRSAVERCARRIRRRPAGRQGCIEKPTGMRRSRNRLQRSNNVHRLARQTKASGMSPSGGTVYNLVRAREPGHGPRLASLFGVAVECRNCLTEPAESALEAEPFQSGCKRRKRSHRKTLIENSTTRTP